MPTPNTHPAGFTPGSWFIHEMDSKSAASLYSIGSTARPGVAVACFASREDAVLIAAAPELLAMLREALPAVEYLADNGSDHSGQWGKTAALIEQALARATGGQP